MIQLATDPLYLCFAIADVGLRETPGKGTTPRITQMLRRVSAWWADDETPWCGTAVGYWMLQGGMQIPSNPWRAKSWLDWGRWIPTPMRGAVGVMARDGGGHVGIVVGVTEDGKICMIGGNQGDSVCVASFDRDRFLGFMAPALALEPPPLMKANGSLSEA